MSKVPTTKPDDLWRPRVIREWRDTVTGQRVAPGSKGAEPTGGYVATFRKYNSEQPAIEVPAPAELVEARTVIDWRSDVDTDPTWRELYKLAAQRWTERDRERVREQKRKQKRKRPSRAKPKEQRERRGGLRQAQKIPGVAETFRNAADAAAQMIGGNAWYFESLDDLDLHDMAREWITMQKGAGAWKRIANEYGIETGGVGGYRRAVPYLEIMAEAVFAPVRSRRWSDVSWWTWDQFLDYVNEAAEFEERQAMDAPNWFPAAYWAFDLGGLGESGLAAAIMEEESRNLGNDLEAMRYGVEQYVVERLANDVGEIELALETGEIPAEIVPIAERRVRAVRAILDKWPREHIPDSVCFYTEDTWPECRALPLREFAAAMSRDCAVYEKCITPIDYAPEPEGVAVDVEPEPEPDWSEVERLFRPNPSMLPPARARERAARALELRKQLPKSKRAGLTRAEAKAQGVTSGIEQARKIAKGQRVDAGQVARFFGRFRGDYEKAKAAGKTAAKDGRIMLAWELWGGEPMRKAVSTKLERARKNPPEQGGTRRARATTPHAPVTMSRTVYEVLSEEPFMDTWQAGDRAAYVARYGEAGARAAEAMDAAKVGKRSARLVLDDQALAKLVGHAAWFADDYDAIDADSKRRARSVAAWVAKMEKTGRVERDSGGASFRPKRDNPKRTNPKRSAPALSKIRDGAELGGLVELEVMEDDGHRLLYRWSRPYPVLWWSPEARALAAVDGGKVSRPKQVDKLPARAAKIRSDFQGEPADRARSVSMPAGKLYKVGRALRVVYESDKFNGGGDGRRALYEHDFAASDVMWTQRKKGPALIAVTGPRLTVTDRGIVY